MAEDDWDREAALTEVGVTYHLLGDLAQAERSYREALASSEERANQVVLMSNLGEVMLDAGRLDEAAAQLRATVQRAHGRATLSAWALGLLVVTEAERGAATSRERWRGRRGRPGGHHAHRHLGVLRPRAYAPGPGTPTGVILSSARRPAPSASSNRASRPGGGSSL